MSLPKVANEPTFHTRTTGAATDNGLSDRSELSRSISALLLSRLPPAYAPVTDHRFGDGCLQETERLVADPAPGISALPHDDNLRYFDVIIEGPGGSPFASQSLLPHPRVNDDC